MLKEEKHYPFTKEGLRQAMEDIARDKAKRYETARRCLSIFTLTFGCVAGIAYLGTEVHAAGTNEYAGSAADEIAKLKKEMEHMEKTAAPQNNMGNMNMDKALEELSKSLKAMEKINNNGINDKMHIADVSKHMTEQNPNDVSLTSAFFEIFRGPKMGLTEVGVVFYMLKLAMKLNNPHRLPY